MGKYGWILREWIYRVLRIWDGGVASTTGTGDGDGKSNG